MDIIKAVKDKTPTALKNIIRHTVLPGSAGRGLTIKTTISLSFLILVGQHLDEISSRKPLLQDGGLINFANIENKVPDIYKIRIVHY